MRHKASGYISRGQHSGELALDAWVCHFLILSLLPCYIFKPMNMKLWKVQLYVRHITMRSSHGKVELELGSPYTRSGSMDTQLLPISPGLQPPWTQTVWAYILIVPHQTSSFSLIELENPWTKKEWSPPVKILGSEYWGDGHGNPQLACGSEGGRWWRATEERK